MAQGTHTYWRMTINNYDATDLALVQQGYQDHVRQLVYTLEEGEEGTPHIQAFIRMHRQVRLSHMKKLFPRGNFGAMDSDEWVLNQKRYAQKLDPTARSPAVITNWDPLLTIEGTLKKVIERFCPDLEYLDGSERNSATYDFLRKRREAEFVEEDYKYAKVFVSATYKAMWREFGPGMVACIHRQWKETQTAEKEAQQCVDIPTHTHTHTRPKILFSTGSINDGQENQGVGSEGEDWEEGEDDDYSSGSEDEATSESGDSECSEEDDCSQP